MIDASQLFRDIGSALGRTEDSSWGIGFPTSTAVPATDDKASRATAMPPLSTHLSSHAAPPLPVHAYSKLPRRRPSPDSSFFNTLAVQGSSKSLLQNASAAPHTLEIHNIPFGVVKGGPRSVFARRQGYRRFFQTVKHGSITCFVEFSDYISAARAISEFNSRFLPIDTSESTEVFLSIRSFDSFVPSETAGQDMSNITMDSKTTGKMPTVGLDIENQPGTDFRTYPSQATSQRSINNTPVLELKYKR
ncbi:hypothetical protein F5X97DRAFT_296421 [Nemania serpens]|nr:hypothetical protein F5X97DRAFT_296421 [Nemania serpens]